MKKKCLILLVTMIFTYSISPNMITLAHGDSETTNKATEKVKHIPFSTLQQDDPFVGDDPDADSFGQPELTNQVKNIIVPNVVDSILKALPAFSYLDQSSIGFGLSFLNDAKYEFSARMSGGPIYTLKPGATIPSDYQMIPGLQINLAYYAGGWNPNTGFTNREYFEMLLIHEMVHAFTMESLVRGWQGIENNGMLNPQEQFPVWFSEGVADAMAGEMSHSLGLGALDQNASDGLIRGLLKTLTKPTTKAVHGVGYYVNLYLGQLISEEEVFSVANIQKGINKTFESLISGVSFDDTIKNYTKYKSIDDFEKRLPYDKKAYDFIRWALKERNFTRADHNKTGFGAVINGDFKSRNLIKDTAPATINPLFKLNSSTPRVLNTYPDTVNVLSGGSLTKAGSKPVTTYPDAQPVQPVKLHVPQHLKYNMKANGEVTVSWNPVDNVASYAVELYKNNVKQSSNNLGDVTQYVFKTNSTDANAYSVKIKAVGNNGKYTDSDQVSIRSSPPVLSGVNNITIKVGDTFNQLQGVSATDKEDGAITNISVSGTVDTSKVGTYTLTYTATDSDGNIQTAIREVRVRSNNKPVITGTQNMTIKVSEVDAFNALSGVHVSDDLDQTLVPVVTGRVEKPVAGTNKDYVLTYTATDSDNNITTATRTITVTNQIPTIAGLGNITIEKGSSADFTTGVSATDREDGNITSSIVFPTVDSTLLAIGTHTLVYSVTDSDNNVFTANRNVMVTRATNIPPVITGIVDTTIKIGEVDTFDLFAGILVKDELDGSIKPTITGSLGKPAAGTNEDYILTYTARDSDGNETTATRTIRVTNQIPSIQGLRELTIEFGETANLTTGISASDHEDGDLTSSIVFPTTDVATLSEGTHILEYTVRDSDGNSVVVDRRIIVTPSTKIAPLILGAEDITIKMGEVDAFQPLAGVQVQDDQETAIIPVVTGSVGKPAAGTNKAFILTYSATDADGNTTTLTRTIIVSNQLPEFKGLHDITVLVGESTDLTTGVRANDHEDGDITTSIQYPQVDIKTLAIGMHILSYSIADSDGNTVSADRLVVVKAPPQPPIPPVLQGGIDSGVIEHISGDGTQTNPIHVEFKDVKKYKADALFAEIEKLNPKISKVIEKTDHILLFVKMIYSSNGLLRSSRAQVETDTIIKINKSHTEAVSSANEFISKYQIHNEHPQPTPSPAPQPTLQQAQTPQDTTKQPLKNNKTVANRPVKTPEAKTPEKATSESIQPPTDTQAEQPNNKVEITNAQIEDNKANPFMTIGILALFIIIVIGSVIVLKMKKKLIK